MQQIFSLIDPFPDSLRFQDISSSLFFPGVYLLPFPRLSCGRGEEREGGNKDGKAVIKGNYSWKD